MPTIVPPMPKHAAAAAALATLALATTAPAQCDPASIFPTTSPTTPAGDQPESVAIADLNNDGIPDLVAANESTSDVSVLPGNGDGTFQPQQPFATGDNPRSSAVADLDASGTPDLVTANTSSDNLSVLLNQCDFGPAITAQPEDSLINAGDNATLSVTAAPSAFTLTFQWQRNNAPLDDDARISGSNTDTLTIANTNAADTDAYTDTYTVVVTNPVGTDRKSTRLNSSHTHLSRMPSSA